MSTVLVQVAVRVPAQEAARLLVTRNATMRVRILAKEVAKVLARVGVTVIN